jgi:branched-chain amino acid transport system permease protein
MTNNAEPTLPPVALPRPLVQATGPESRRRTLPVSAGGLGWLCVLVLACLLCYITSASTQTYLVTWAIYAIGAISLTVLTGVAGLPSIGNSAFLAIGAYTVALIPFTTTSVFVGMALGAVVGGVGGLIAGLPSLRLRGLYLAVSTLALYFIVYSGAQLLEEDTNHPAGYTIPGPQLWSGALLTGRGWYLFLVAVVAVYVFLIRNLLRSRIGRSWLAVRELDSLSGVFGVAPGVTKLTVFVFSSAMVGLSGALLAVNSGTIISGDFSLQLGVLFILMIVIGGAGSIGGAIAGSGAAVLLPYFLQQVGQQVDPNSMWLSQNAIVLEYGVFGALIVVLLLFYPSGLAGLGRYLLSLAGMAGQRLSGRWRARVSP